MTPALAKILGEAGLGVFAAARCDREGSAAAVQGARRRSHHGIRQRFFAISVERKIRHPAAVAICEAARKNIFA